ncbi:MAG: DNA polymerase I [Candidatus Falkowbacteria bacterium]
MPKKSEKLIIIDGNALIHRSFHALPPTMTTKSGQVVNAVYGFTLFLLKAIEEFKPEYIALTFDRKEATFRHLEYKEYKATRVKAPDELYTQIPLAKKMAEAFAIPIFELAGFEADDLIGTICRRVDGSVDKYIITGDLDALQLVNNHTFVYTMSRGLSDSVLYDDKKVKERFDLNPNQIIDYKALRGDVSDNIPGVKGIGEKTAAELLNNFKTLDGVYAAVANSDAKIKPRTLELLKTDKDKAYLSQKLATIDVDVPFTFDLAATKVHQFNKSKILEVFGEMEFRSLIPRLNNIDKYLGGETKADELEEQNNSTDNFPDKFTRDTKLFKYELIDSEEKFVKFYKKLAAQTIFTFDTETTGLNPLTCDLLGISFSWEEGEAYYVKIETEKNANANNNLFAAFEKPANKQNWLEQLAPIFADAKIKKCGHNMKYDIRVLQAQGLKFAGAYFDTMIASYLLNPENRQHNLDALTFSELAFEKINHDELLGIGKDKKDFGQVEVAKMAIYSCEDADFTNRLVHILTKNIEKEKLDNLFFEIEMPLIPVLAKMENTGILIDPQILADMKKTLNHEIAALEKKIYELAGTEFNVSSPKQLKEILFEKLAIASKGIKKTKTGLSTAADELNKMKDAHPIIPLIQNYRESTKLLTTYVDALPEMINKNDGRVHTNYNQSITATGRLSSNEPNLQNIPTRTEMGKKIRTAFIAKPGSKLLSLDYSQIELRLAAHMSGDKKMLAAFKANEDIHTATAAAIAGVKLSEVTKDMRREAKAINFGIIYGQGPHGLSEGAGISYAAAREFIDKYFKVYSGVKKYIDNSIATAKKNSYVETLCGRRRYLPEINSTIAMVQKSAERMAINMPLQGTAADIIKLAMIKIDELLDDKNDIKMLLQVHDELIFEIVEDKIEFYTKKLKDIMEHVLDLNVPIIVDAGVAKNWGEIK